MRQGGLTLVFVAETEAGKWWCLVVKRTADGRETYLVAFRRIKPNQVRFTTQHSEAIRRGGGEWLAPGGAHSLLAQPKPRGEALARAPTAVYSEPAVDGRVGILARCHARCREGMRTERS